MPMRTLGLAAVMLSVVLLVTALVGGMTGESPKAGAAASSATMEPVRHSAAFANGGLTHDENLAPDGLAIAGSHR